MKTDTLSSALSSLLIIAALLLASCTGNTPVAPGASTATPAVQATALLIAPAITLKPDQASFDTTVTVTGSGFPARTRIKIYLGVAHTNTLQPYVAAVTDDGGKFIVALSMPDRWASGASITETDLTLVAANDDFSLQAEAPLSFQLAAAPQPPPPPPATPLPPPAVPITPTRAPTGPTARVNFEFLNVRSGPGINYDLVAKLAQNDPVSLLGRNDDSTWARLRLPDGREGWAFAQYLQASVEIASLPLATVSPGPPATRLPATLAAPIAANEQEAILAAVLGFYTGWASGPGPNGNLAQALKYLSPSLADQIRADNSALLQRLGVPSRPKYAEVETQRFDGATALIRATLQYDSGNHVVDTSLTKENGVWVITQFQPVTP